MKIRLPEKFMNVSVANVLTERAFARSMMVNANTKTLQERISIVSSASAVSHDGRAGQEHRR